MIVFRITHTFGQVQLYLNNEYSTCVLYCIIAMDEYEPFGEHILV